MGAFVGDQRKGVQEEMRLRVERILRGKNRRFDLVIERPVWEGLHGYNAVAKPDTSAYEAYRHDKDFYDFLAELNADQLSRQGEPGATEDLVEAVIDSLQWLDAEYRIFLAERAKS